MAQKKGFHGFLEKSALPIFVVILIPVAIVAYAVWSSTAGSQAPAPAPTATQTTSAPTNMTQATIALNDPSTLPQTVAAAELIPFSFTIQNTGNADGTVPYKVYVKWSTGEQDVIDENVVTLTAGASAVVDENLKFEIATETAAVYLELTQTGQTVQFVLPRAQ
jgi:hypothetical protein